MKLRLWPQLAVVIVGFVAFCVCRLTFSQTELYLPAIALLVIMAMFNSVNIISFSISGTRSDYVIPLPAWVIRFGFLNLAVTILSGEGLGFVVLLELLISAIAVSWMVVFLGGMIQEELKYDFGMPKYMLELQLARMNAVKWIEVSLFGMLVCIVGQLPAVYFSGAVLLLCLTMYLLMENENDRSERIIFPSRAMPFVLVLLGSAGFVANSWEPWSPFWQAVMLFEYLASFVLVILSLSELMTYVKFKRGIATYHLPD